MLEIYGELTEIEGCGQCGMPEIKSIDDYKSVFGAQGISVSDVSKDGFAYYSIGFWCDWDEEHNFGVMMHKGRIVQNGGCDTSFLQWIAKQDLKGE